MISENHFEWSSIGNFISGEELLNVRFASAIILKIFDFYNNNSIIHMGYLNLNIYIMKNSSNI